MVYTEYKDASLRHLNTCEELVTALNTVKKATIERHMVQNIYYLSGYVIECIVNYAIYDYVQFGSTANVRGLNAAHFDVSFDYRNRRFTIKTHKYQDNCLFFAYHSVSDASSIPYFDGYIPNPQLTPLFQSWKPEARYTDYQFDKQDVIDFVGLAKEIYLKTRQLITKN